MLAYAGVHRTDEIRDEKEYVLVRLVTLLIRHSTCWALWVPIQRRAIGVAHVRLFARSSRHRSFSTWLKLASLNARDRANVVAQLDSSGRNASAF